MRFIYLKVIFAACMLFCQCGRYPSDGRASSKLPHNDYLSSLTVSAAVERLRKDPETDVLLAMSKGFWGTEDFDGIYAAYAEFYDQKKKEFSSVLGPPVFDGNWTQKDYPVWAVGESVTTWGTGDKAVYLRLYHEDKEFGIEVSFLTPASESSNHEAESIYKKITDLKAPPTKAN